MNLRPRPPRSPAPAAASTAIAPWLRGERRPARVLAAFPAAVYLEHDDGVVALVVADGIHHPNAVVLTASASARPLAAWHARQRACIGDGAVEVTGQRVTVTRWFDPVPRLAATTAPALGAGVAVARAEVVRRAGPAPATLVGPLEELAAAVHAGDEAVAVGAARRLVGRGPGLTPSGDDVLAGLLASIRLLGPAVSGDDAARLVATSGHVGDQVAVIARHATTTISAALLRHAAAGEVAAPAGSLLHALCGRGDLAAAVAGLLDVGASSGHDLALGLFAGADLVLASATVPRPA